MIAESIKALADLPPLPPLVMLQNAIHNIALVEYTMFCNRVRSGVYLPQPPDYPTSEDVTILMRQVVQSNKNIQRMLKDGNATGHERSMVMYHPALKTLERHLKVW